MRCLNRSERLPEQSPINRYLTRFSEENVAQLGQIQVEMPVRRMRQHVAQAIEVPFAILANYLAGAQISLIGWWLESHSPL